MVQVGTRVWGREMYIFGRLNPRNLPIPAVLKEPYDLNPEHGGFLVAR